jgi:hypothetical protein
VLWGFGVEAAAALVAGALVAGVVEVLDDADVLWLAGVLVVLETEVELDDPPHAASSSASDPSPAAAHHPLLRIVSLFPRRMTRSRVGQD